MNKNVNQYYEMSKWALVGGLLGIILGLIFDTQGLAENHIAEAIVRLVSGTMDSISEILFLLFVTIQGKNFNKIKPYVYGTFIGTVFAPICHFVIASSVINPYGTIGVIYAFAYSNSDNLFGALVLLTFLVFKYGSQDGLRKFWQEPFQRGNIFALVAIFIGAIIIRTLGFYPNTNTLASIEAALMDFDTVIASIFAITVHKKFSKSEK